MEKKAAYEDVLNIEGVKAAANNLKVVYPVVVEKGRATLTGTLTSRVARSHVHETLMHTPGVTDIEDQIQVVADVFKKNAIQTYREPHALIP